MQQESNRSVIVKIFVLMVAFYLVMMAIWYYSSPNHRPSNVFYDWRKEGYTQNPFEDRYGQSKK